MNNSEDESTVLFRPVGQKELELIEQSGFKKFPPRLFHQPIFYPVLNQQYAEQIARDWNTKDPVSGYAGYVTRFRIRSQFLSRYPVKTVGAQSLHEELWIPAEDLDEMHANLIGLIEVIAEFHTEKEE